MLNNKNKEYWDKLNIKYSNVWKSKAKQKMSLREMNFISYYLTKFKPHKILDIGAGNGRILDNHIKNSPENTEIFGVDISEKMVEICKDRFKKERRMREIKKCDVSTENLCFSDSFDFITAVRILKYNKNWQEILVKIYNKLNKNGILVFTMLNINSADRFLKHKASIHKTTKKDIEDILQSIGYEIIEIKSFTKIPDVFYGLFDNYFYASLLTNLEKFLELVLGKTFLGRILFVVCRKK